MYCSEHPYREAVGRCLTCSQAVCLDCMNKTNSKIYCHVCQPVSTQAPLLPYAQQSLTTVATTKRRELAAALAVVLGTFGIHKFYLGQYGWGILYFLFSWSGIPAVAGLIEGIVLLVRPEADFIRRYGEVQTVNAPALTTHRPTNLSIAGSARALPPQDYERLLLQFAQRNQGLISIAHLMADGLDLGKVEDALANLAAKGLVLSEMDDNGRILHYVPEFRN